MRAGTVAAEDLEQAGQWSIPSSGEGRYVARARLAEIDGRALLFSASSQAIFELNDTAAEIWRTLVSGATPASIARGLMDCGAPASQARAFVDAALGEWERLDLVHPALPPTSSRPDCPSQIVAVADLRVRIDYRQEQPCPAAAVFRHLEAEGEAADLRWEVVQAGSRLHLYREGDWVASCSPDELPTSLKGHLLAEILNRGGYELAMHVAALVNGDRALLLSGRPGAGKTTLTLALVRGGFGFGGDDVTLLRSDGRCVPLPFAPAVKGGAWRILEPHCPVLSSAPVFRRPDGRRVRYPVPEQAIRPAAYGVGCIVLLDRRRGAAADLQRLDPAAALRGLLAGSFALGGGLTDGAFDVLARVLGSADVFRLTYWSLDDAVELLKKSCP
jgi:hypothetical protein